jgi:hypothetical protein
MILTALLAILMPATIAGVTVLLLAQVGVTEKGSGLGAAVGLALGFAAGQVALVGWPGLFPVDATYRLLHLALAGAAVGVGEVLWKDKAPVLWVLRSTLGALVLGLLLRSVMEHTWEGSEAIFWLVGLFVAILGFGAALQHLAQTTRSLELVVLLVLLISAASIGLVFAHSAFLGQLGGALAAGLGGVGVVMLVRPATRLSPGGIPVVTAVFTALLLCGYFFATLPAVSAVLLWLAPGAAALGGFGALAKRAPWQILVLRIVLLLLFAATAVYLAYSANAVAATDYSSY